jgi:hypothetical protein
VAESVGLRPSPTVVDGENPLDELSYHRGCA